MIPAPYECVREESPEPYENPDDLEYDVIDDCVDDTDIDSDDESVNYEISSLCGNIESPHAAAELCHSPVEDRKLAAFFDRTTVVKIERPERPKGIAVSFDDDSWIS